jgi:hypothetical protein
MERARNPANMSVQISLTNESKKTLNVREPPFNTSVMERSLERRKIHKNDIKRLEAKIKKLDQEINETEKMRDEVSKYNSISTHETEMDEEQNSMQTPAKERKSMPVRSVKNTLGQIRGLITHMVDLVNRDPASDPNLSSELSQLVKFRAELKSEKETPEVIKSIKSMLDRTPVETSSKEECSYHNMSVPEALERTKSKKRAQSKYDDKRTPNHYPRHRKVWKEDLDYYSNFCRNSLAGESVSNKRQKTVERDEYLSYSEKEEFPFKFKRSKPLKKISPRINPF